jgi:DNA repair photolyase
MPQLTLFDDSEQEERKSKLGHASIEYKKAASILTPASGFLNAYDFSLNPYSGCSFGCTYCYAAFFSRDAAKIDNWGYWVTVKENALDLLKKLRKKPMKEKTLYMSSVTDPYQPIEKSLELTRNILFELADFHDIRLVLQTRAALVTRDIDVLSKFKVAQVNMTVTTDSEEVRKAFEPLCSSNKVRLEAIKLVNAAGIQSCITMTPLLPIENGDSFADMLLETEVKRFIVQPFHTGGGGKFIRGTREDAHKILTKYNWSQTEYLRIYEILKSKLPNLGEGQDGFAPI